MADLTKALEAAKELGRRDRKNGMARYAPYEKQIEFHNLSADYKERMLRAGNRVGKSYAGSREMAFHLTGIYPKWWKGKRFEKAIDAWAGGPDEKSTRMGLQRLLCGKFDAEEKFKLVFDEAIPEHLVKRVTFTTSTAGLVDTIQVQHVSGGVSELVLKNFAQGWEKWQSAALDVVWFDEEPSDIKLYHEGRKRTLDKRGIAYMTFTPLNGYTEAVERFLNHEPGTMETHMTWEDSPIMAPLIDDEKAAMRSTPHMIDPVIYGKPTAGSGAVYPILDEEITCDDFETPEHWLCIGGQDYGWTHPSAFVKLAWDRDNDVIYVTNAHKKSNALPVVHASAVRHWGGNREAQWLPWAWGKEGLHKDKGSGKSMASQYGDEGLLMLKIHARDEVDGDAIEPGIARMLHRMQTGRFKVFRSCQQWFQEKGLYSRDEDGMLKTGNDKKNDDLMDATRYASMMLAKHGKAKLGFNTRAEPGDAPARNLPTRRAQHHSGRRRGQGHGSGSRSQRHARGS